MQKVMTELYDFSNNKFTKILCLFLVVEAYGFIYPRPSGENSSFAIVKDDSDSDVDSEASRRQIWAESKSRFALPYSWPNINWIVA